MGSPKAPPPRNLGQETRDTLQAQIDLAPKLYESEALWGPKYANLEVQNWQRAIFGGGESPGFLSLLEQSQPRMDALTKAQTSRQREADIADVLRLGPQAQTAFRSADPAQAALIDELTRQANEEVRLGAALDPSLRNEVAQAVRAGQADRGMGYGPSDIFEEAMSLAQAGQNLRNQRRTFASSIASQRAGLYGDPFLQILGRPAMNVSQGNFLGQQGQAFAQDAGPQLFNPESSYASDLYNTNYNAKAAARIAEANNKFGLIGAGLGAVGNIFGGFLAGRKN